MQPDAHESAMPFTNEHLLAENRRLIAELASLKALQGQVACVFCTWTAPAPAEAMVRKTLLRAHVAECPGHPMRELEAKLAHLGVPPAAPLPQRGEGAGLVKALESLKAQLAAMPELDGPRLAAKVEGLLASTQRLESNLEVLHRLCALFRCSPAELTAKAGHARDDAAWYSDYLRQVARRAGDVRRPAARLTNLLREQGAPPREAELAVEQELLKLFGEFLAKPSVVNPSPASPFPVAGPWAALRAALVDATAAIRYLGVGEHRGCGSECSFARVNGALDALLYAEPLLEALGAQGEMLRQWRKERIRASQDSITLACALVAIMAAGPTSAAEAEWERMDKDMRHTWVRRAEAFAVHLLGEPMEFFECPGVGKCHGPLTWCMLCGNVSMLCEGEGRCDLHRARWAEYVAEKAPWMEDARREGRDAERRAIFLWLEQAVSAAAGRSKRLLTSILEQARGLDFAQTPTAAEIPPIDW